MSASYWHQRWQEEKICFHQSLEKSSAIYYTD